jgi:hypothetical protein
MFYWFEIYNKITRAESFLFYIFLFSKIQEKMVELLIMQTKKSRYNNDYIFFVSL